MKNPICSASPFPEMNIYGVASCCYVRVCVSTYYIGSRACYHTLQCTTLRYSPRSVRPPPLLCVGDLTVSFVTRGIPLLVDLNSYTYSFNNPPPPFSIPSSGNPPDIRSFPPFRLLPSRHPSNDPYILHTIRFLRGY